jgi:hypothetical protein
VLGPPGSALNEIDRLQAKLVAVRPMGAQAKAAAAVPRPSFTLFAQGVPASVTLQGVSILPDHRAALISIGGAEAGWLDVGETRDGVTLVEVQPFKIIADTDEGTKDIELGQGPSIPAVAKPSVPVRPEAEALSLGAPNRLSLAVATPSPLSRRPVQPPSTVAAIPGASNAPPAGFRSLPPPPPLAAPAQPRGAGRTPG